MRVDLWSLSVSRGEVERREITPALLELAPLLTPANLERFRRRVTLTVDGYADDPRDLYPIDQAREWVRLLDVAVPFWLYFADLGSESALRWWPFCLCLGGRCRAAS